MVLDKKRLIRLIKELDNNLLEELRILRASIMKEIQWISSEPGYDELILEVSLSGLEIKEDYIHTGEQSDIVDTSMEIHKYRNEQKDILYKSLKKCYAKQTVAFRVYGQLGMRTKNEQDILLTCIRVSVEEAARNFRHSKSTILKIQHAILDDILDKVNKEIVDVEDYDM